MNGYQVRAAEPSERREALTLVFQHCPPDEQTRRAESALDLIQKGILRPDGLLILQYNQEMAGAVLSQDLKGATALLWPPQTQVVDQTEAEDCLIQTLHLQWLQSQIKVVQVLLEPEEMPWSECLLRNGFRHITALRYLRHFLHISSETAKNRLVFRPWSEVDSSISESVLLRTYQESQDCPELNGILTMAEILQSHASPAGAEENHWWIAFDRDCAIGALLLAATVPGLEWELSYMGLIPEARGKGYGKEILLYALLEAKTEEIQQLHLTVDQRNRPAWNLYRSMGFEDYDHRQVYLHILQGNTLSQGAHS